MGLVLGTALKPAWQAGAKRDAVTATGRQHRLRFTAIRLARADLSGKAQYESTIPSPRNPLPLFGHI